MSKRLVVWLDESSDLNYEFFDNYVAAAAFVEKNENKSLILTPYTEPSSDLTIMVEDRT